MRHTIVLLLAALVAAPAALAQRATERYIPIGKSPGLSGKRTYTGSIRIADPKARMISGPSWNATVTERTRIWIDRSKSGRTNTTGTFDDLKPGRRVEVKYKGTAKDQGPADWIKVEAAGG